MKSRLASYNKKDLSGSGKTRLLEQANILVINVPNNRTEHCLHNDMLSVHMHT